MLVNYTHELQSLVVSPWNELNYWTDFLNWTKIHCSGSLWLKRMLFQLISLCGNRTLYLIRALTHKNVPSGVHKVTSIYKVWKKYNQENDCHFSSILFSHLVCVHCYLRMWLVDLWNNQAIANCLSEGMASRNLLPPTVSILLATRQKSAGWEVKWRYTSPVPGIGICGHRNWRRFEMYRTQS